MIVRERVPTNLIAVRDMESDECRPPPTAMTIVSAARTPCPIVVVINPTTIVIRRPAPRFMAHPSPTVRRHPNPTAIAIRRPIAITLD